MQCPICEEYGKTYASKPMGALEIRYRCCDGCGHRFRTFEEIDTDPKIRNFEKTRRIPVDDPSNIICPDCGGNHLNIDRRPTRGKMVTHFFICQGCDLKFGVEADLSDPIAKARKDAAEKARVICPECNGPSLSKGIRRTKTRTIRRHECKECGHRFKHIIAGLGAEVEPPVVCESEIDHRVMP